jgi:Leu/Phe-tRNA-protein transferase
MASNTTHQDWINRAIQQIYTMLEDCGYMADQAENAHR